MDTLFSSADIEQLGQHGVSLEQAEQQMHAFQTGFPPLDIVAPASRKQGVLVPTKVQQE